MAKADPLALGLAHAAAEQVFSTPKGSIASWHVQTNPQRCFSLRLGVPPWIEASKRAPLK